jgi:hypothetical protein
MKGSSMANGEPTVSGMQLEMLRSIGSQVKDVNENVGKVFLKLGEHGETLAAQGVQLEHINEEQKTTSGVIKLMTKQLQTVEKNQFDCEARKTIGTVQSNINMLLKKQSIAPKEKNGINVPLEIVVKVARWAIPTLIASGAAGAMWLGWTP